MDNGIEEFKKKIFDKIVIQEKSLENSKQRLAQYQHLAQIESKTILGLEASISTLKDLLQKEN